MKLQINYPIGKANIVLSQYNVYFKFLSISIDEVFFHQLGLTDFELFANKDGNLSTGFKREKM